MAVSPTTGRPTVPQVATNPFESEFTGPAWPDHFGEWIAKWSRLALPEPVRTLSLFTGAGGLDIGFRQAGFHAVEMVEYDARFVPTLEANCGMFGLFGDSTPRCIDVRKYDSRHLNKIDFIIGGPPCQSFSAAGRRAGGVRGTDDERGQLFLSYVHLLKRLKPRGFLFENVYGITGANGGRDWRAIREAFADAGYSIFHRILDSADFGVPQHRERMFIVGRTEGNYQFPRPTHGPDSPRAVPHYNAATAIQGAPNVPNEKHDSVNGRYGHLLAEIPPGLNYSYFTERMGHPRPLFAWRSKFSDFLYKADPSRPVRTIKAQGGQYTGPFHWENRAFATAELKRLQTFPDGYRIAGSRAVVTQQIGNSVPPQVARILALSILQQVFNVDIPVSLPLLDEQDELSFRSKKRELTRYYSGLAKSAEPVTIDSVGHKPRAHTRHIALTEDFRLIDRKRERDGIAVAFRPTLRRWQFTAAYPESSKTKSSFTIRIRARDDAEWPLPCEFVVLEGRSLDLSVFTVVWKVFEAELQQQALKADLVQLSGYYQYEPAFTSSMEFVGRVPWMWRALSKVVAGNGVRRTLPAPIIASLWGIDVTQLPRFAQFLRALGMEVRNNHTNSQIPKGEWLLPYAFPSLNHKSVQLRKELCE